MNIYLDSASTTKPKIEVIETMMPYLVEQWYNPSSLYSSATKIRENIEAARNTVGNFIGANGRIYFTSGGSEANCWAIKGFIDQCEYDEECPVIITSSIEHKSIMSCVGLNGGIRVGVNKSGLINIDELEDWLKWYTEEGNRILVSIQFANNEIGTIQHIKEIADMVHYYGAILHTDAVQAFGHIIIDVEALGIDMLSASGHKIGTPKGVGFLYIRDGIKIKPLIYGTQMDGMRGGTENVAGIIGMAKAIELCEHNIMQKMIEFCNQRDYMIRRLKERFNVKVNGSETQRLSNNINVTFPQDITAEALIYLLETSGIYISAGSACNSQSIEPSYVLKAIGSTDEEAMKTIRITLPDDITFKEIDYVIEEIEKSIKLIESN